MTPKAPKSTIVNLGTPSRAPKFEILPKPVEVVVKLSEKSFINPIFGAEADRYDICINVFYNGEFSASQVIKYSAWAANDSKIYVNLGGRRIGTCHELPWMISTKPENAHISLSPINKHAMALRPVDRWNKLTEMLLLEANEWGRDERGYRLLTGEFLELLSRKTMPSELDSPLVSTGCDFGVIDVVITLGRMSHLDATKEICSPLRHLPASQFQKTDIPVVEQIGSRRATPTQAAAIDLSRGYPSGLSNLNLFALVVDPTDTPGSSSTSETSHVVAASSHERDWISSGSLEVATPTTDGILHSAGPQAVARRTTSMSARIPAPLAVAPTPRPPHPHRPENIPQKRYRGSEPVLPPSPLSKRQKTANLFEELPFDLNTAAYMSTRARRSASMPFAQTPPKPQPESAIKRKRSVNQVKSTLFNAESSGTPVAGTPLTPKKDKIDNPKTPESGGPLKKKPRSSNYNPKLSNRPQNLRRKNSAGEWIIPPSRKNSSGEWETPTKGGQVKAAGVLGGHGDRATPEENEKIFQPVFTISADDASRNMATGPSALDGTSLIRNKTTLKGIIHPQHTSVQANKVANPAIVTEIKKENINPSKEAEQTDEIAITAIATKFTDSFPKVAFKEARGTQKKVLLGTSPIKAGAAAFDKYFRGLKKDGKVTGNKNKPQKKTLRIRFFQGNISSDGEIVGNGRGERRWLVRRCIAPEYTPASGNWEKPTSYPLFEKPKSFSAFATGPQGEKVTNVVTDSALKAAARSRRKSSTGHDVESSIMSSSTIATLRSRRMATVQQHRKFDINQSRPRFVVPNHNSRVLKLVRRQGFATETDGITHEAQGAFGEAVVSNSVGKKVAADATNHVDGGDEGGSSAFATNSESPNIPQQDTGVNSSSAAQSVDITYTELVAETFPTLTKAKDPPPDSDSEAQTLEGDQTSAQMRACRTAPKRPFRPRTVGFTELKALLESHDRHSVVNTSLGSPLGMMHSQFMTRASRKAISFKPRKVIGPSEIVTDTQVSCDKLTVQLPVTSKGAPRKRSSSGQFIENTAVAASVQGYTKDTDGGLSKIEDAQTSGKANSDASSYKVETPLLSNQKNDTPKPSIVTTMGCDLSLLGAGELPPSDTSTAQTIKKAVSRCQKGPETSKGTMMVFEEETIIPIRRLETPVINLRGAPIDRTTSRRQKSKEEAQSGTGNAMKFEEAAEEVDVALKQVCKANTEINKAAGDLESLITHTSAQRKSQNAARLGTSNAKTAEASLTDIHRGQEQNTPTPSALAHGAHPSKPGCVCHDSILTYATDENWDGLERNPVTGQKCRRVGTQEGGYFTAFSVLMGVRYVVVGSAVAKDR